MQNYFWFIAGIFAGFCATLVLLPLWRGAVAAFASKITRTVIAVIAGVVFVGAALTLYLTLGHPELLDNKVAASAPPAHPGASASATAGPADSMESAVAQLEARVARDGGKRADWALLAQSYEFLGRTDDAQRARQKANEAESAAPTAAPLPAQPAASVSADQYEQRVRANPRDAEAWLALAGLYRQQHAYAKSRDAFVKVQKLGAMTADAWADYADTLASLAGGSLRGDAARAIDSALALNPKHPKALWLEASLAHEERRYADALSVWKQLRDVLPPGSSDVRIVDANIGEASELAGVPVALHADAAAPIRTEAAEVSGTVSIDRTLASRVPPGATLFIYAKAADSPGPPLAVLRQTAGAWPVSFRLDDTLAMIPTRKLSQFEKVIVEARVSRSGQATPAAGDLYVTSAVLKPGERKKLALVINHEVG